MNQAVRHYNDDDTTPPINFDPKKSRFTLPLFFILAILGGGFYAGQYVSRLLTKIDNTAVVAEVHTKQLADLADHTEVLNRKIDSFISIQNDRAKWQSSSLRAIAQKVGANSYPLPTDESSNK